MKIAIITESFPPADSGAALTAYAYARCLAERGHEVLVAAPRQPKHAEPVSLPCELVPVPVLADVAQGEYPLVSPFAFKAKKRLQEFAPELIHAHTPFLAASMARKLGEKLRVPVVLTLHARYETDIERFANSPITRGVAHNMMMENIRGADEVWVPSHAAAEHLRGLKYIGGHVLMPAGAGTPQSSIDDEGLRARLNIPHNAPLILVKSRLLRHKNLFTLLDALELLRGRETPVHALIVGDGADRRLLDDYAVERRLDGLTHFLSAANGAGADLCVVADTSDNGAHILADASGKGLATLAVQGSAAAGFIEHGVSGFTCPDGVVGLADGIADALSDKRRRTKIAATARAKLYEPWESVCGSAIKRYEALTRIHAARLDETDYLDKHRRQLSQPPVKAKLSKLKQ
ncbi:glycosyl transferase [Clostridia bacterium]|nr:glycosyl transferase [Clostridia bacterium]